MSANSDRKGGMGMGVRFLGYTLTVPTIRVQSPAAQASSPHPYYRIDHPDCDHAYKYIFVQSTQANQNPPTTYLLFSFVILSATPTSQLSFYKMFNAQPVTAQAVVTGPFSPPVHPRVFIAHSSVWHLLP